MIKFIKELFMGKKPTKVVRKKCVEQRPMTHTELIADGYIFVKPKGTMKVYTKNGRRIMV